MGDRIHAGAKRAERRFDFVGWFGEALARAYDVAVKQIDCVCGVVVRGEDDDELWERAQEHLRSDHPELVGKVAREDILAQAEET